MWGQCDELPDGGVVDEPFGVVVADEPLGVVVADVEPLAVVDAVEDELPVAALATAAPPPTRAPVSTTPASVCRSLIFIPRVSFLGVVPSLSTDG